MPMTDDIDFCALGRWRRGEAEQAPKRLRKHLDQEVAVSTAADSFKPTDATRRVSCDHREAMKLTCHRSSGSGF